VLERRPARIQVRILIQSQTLITVLIVKNMERNLANHVKCFALFIKDIRSGRIYSADVLYKEPDGRLWVSAKCIYNPDPQEPGVQGSMSAEITGLFDSSRHVVSTDLSLLFL
jgi:hypothetical protein